MANLTRLKAICEVDSSSAEVGLTRLHGGLGKLTGAMGIATGALAALGIGIAGAFALKSAIDTTTNLGEEVYKLSHMFGLSAESASKWSFIAHRAGIEADTLGRGMKMMSKNLETMALHLENKGTPDTFIFAQALKEIGVKAFDTKGHILGLDEIMARISDKFEAMPDSIQKTGLATALFGKNGAELIPVLDLGRKGLEELSAEAQKYGLIISGPNLAAIHAYVLKHRELDAAMQGMQLTIGTALIPVLTALTGQVTGTFQAIRTWINANPAVVTSLQHLGEAGVNAVHRAIDALILVITGPKGAQKTTDDLGGKAELAAMKFGGKQPDSLASSITSLSDKLTTFLNSKSTKDFMDFWNKIADGIGKAAGLLDKFNQLVGAQQKMLAGNRDPHAGSGFEIPLPGAGGGKLHVPLPFAQGLDYVPYDNFPALLHKGERVMTAGENQGGRGQATEIHVHVDRGAFIDGPSVDRLANAVAQRLSYVTGR